MAAGALGAPPVWSAPASDVPPALQELRRHMFDPTVNSLTFRSVDQIFTIRKVPHAGQPWVLPRQDAEPDFNYEFGGQRYNAREGLERTRTNAFLIIRNGRIVTEIYRNNTDASTHFISWSMAKSITSTLVGLALHDGLIGSLEDPIIKYLPELANSGYRGVTLRQALQMRSGVGWDERYDFGVDSPAQQAFELGLVQNVIHYVDPALNLKNAHPPGEVFNYSTIETSVLGWVLERVLKRPISGYMTERLWEPAGMEADGFWLLDGAPGVGREFTGAGFNAVLRDYGRFAQMALDGGRANGRQIVPGAWLETATTPYAGKGKPMPASPLGSLGYGFQWWTVNGTHAYAALGLQGQYMYVDPPTRTVIVKLSYFPPGDDKLYEESLALLKAAAAWSP